MASTSSFRFWRKAVSKASFKEVTGFDLFYQLIYMSAIASAGISRNKIFEFGASLPRQAAAYFNRVHLVCRRLGYEYSTACTLVGEAADSDAMKSLLLRFADALAAGQPEVTFLTEEADVQGNAYEKEYERDLASLTKWTDAYAAIVVSSALIIIINLVSALIYDMGISMTVGLVVTGVLTAAGGAWVLSRAAPPEVRVHFSSTGPQAQRRTRQLLKGVPVFFSYESQVNSLNAMTLDFEIPDFLLSQIVFKVFHSPFQMTLDSLFCFNFKDQVHTAHEVKTEMYFFFRQKT